ncbi:MAG TPA: hypothetical protein VGC56_16995 [Allosphingosinicella sp.]
MANCAWSEAPATAATLVARVKFDRQYVYDADGSPTVGLLMRIRAACREQAKAVAQAAGAPISKFDNRKFLKILAGTRPAAVGADRYAGIVRRCEFRFVDGAMEAPAAIIWRSDVAGVSTELSRSEQMLGFTPTPAEVAALLSPKKSPEGLLERAEAAKPVRVSSLAVGKASRQPYAIDYEAAAQRCQAVKADGSYEDA